MAITSETQRRYDPKKGGYAYFTLFRSSEKGERPEWAQDGDILEENCEGGGNYECKRDAKGRIKWEVASDWDRQTGGGSSGGGEGGGGGVEPFFVTAAVDDDTVTFDKTFAQTTAAIQAGQDVYLTFGGLSYPLYRFAADNDAFAAWIVGDVDERQEIDMAEENGETVGWISNVQSGVAEKFVVTLTKTNDTWTAGKTVAEIVAAKEAGKIVECEYPFTNDVYVSLPCLLATTIQGVLSVAFSGLIQGENTVAVFVNGYSQNDTGGWNVDRQELASTNEPLIVTLTADGSTGNLVGDKTFGDVVEAVADGRNVVLSADLGNDTTTYAQVIAAGSASGLFVINTIIDTELKRFSGSQNDYVAIQLGG